MLALIDWRILLSRGPYSPFRFFIGKLDSSRNCSRASISRSGAASVICAVGVSISSHCRKPPGSIQVLVSLRLILPCVNISLTSLIEKQILNILNSLARFLTKTVGSLFLINTATSRICNKSNFATKSSGTSVKKSQERNWTLRGSQARGGHCARLMSRPVRLAVGGREDARSRSQILANGRGQPGRYCKVKTGTHQSRGNRDTLNPSPRPRLVHWD